MKKLNELTIKEAIAGLGSGEFTSVELVSACYEQIARFDSSIRAFVTIVPKAVALAKAQEADDLIIAQGSSAFETKKLLGIPYACKDNFCTKGVETTAASNILKGFLPPYESTVTKKLMEAGAILLGKTNMDAFAHGSSTETSDFFVTKNPWDETRVAGGSSGGSTAAVALHMCVFAIGSETAGSIRGPASWCGVVGLKPTYGAVSRYGVIAMASSTDSPGPITKTVGDAGYVLDVIGGHDQLDATSAAKVSKSPVKDIKDVVLGVPKSYFASDLQQEVNDAVRSSIAAFERLGAKIVGVDLLDPKYSIAVYTVIQRAEVSSNLARYDGIRFGHARPSFGFEAKKRMMLGAYALSAGYYDQFYAKAQKVRTLLIRDFEKAFDTVDLFVAPTMPVTALKLGGSQTSPIFGELMDMLLAPSSIAGLPAVSVPVGNDAKHLPIGLQLIGPMFSEEQILAVASIFERKRPGA